MRRHIDRVSSAFLAYGVLQVLLASLVAVGSLAMMGALLAHGRGDTGMSMGAMFYGAVAAIAVFVGVFMAVPCILAGTGLRLRRAWARPAALVVSALILAHAPFGTVLALYAFRVLFDPDVRFELERGG